MLTALQSSYIMCYLIVSGRTLLLQVSAFQGTCMNVNGFHQMVNVRGPLHLVANGSTEDVPETSIKAEEDLLVYSNQFRHYRETTIDKSSQMYISMMVYFHRLNQCYTAVNSKIKCPFFRRRISDVIDGMAMIGRFLVIRHKSILSDPSFSVLLGYEYTVPGCLPLLGKGEGGQVVVQNAIFAANQEKLKHQSIDTISAIIKKDWLGKHASGSRGYYITGKLSTEIYRNDCLFDGPDPDMPVRGLRKYLSAASHLFDQGKSHAKMLSITHDDEKRTVTVRWLLGGILMLPWRPTVKDWTGCTVYYLDEEGLVYKHSETWDISVWEAFVSTAFPGVGHMVWGGMFPFMQ